MEPERETEVRAAALRLLARREHSHRELARKLAQRGFESALIDTVLEALVRENLLSDQRFAEEYVRSRRNQGYGPLRIRSELAERGVQEGLAEPFLYADEDWVELAAEVRRKRFGQQLPEDMKERARQYRFLAQRGFSGDDIRRALRTED